MTLTQAEEHAAEAAVPESFVRFSAWRRAEHWLLVLSFVTLLVTGLPQKYDDAAFSEWIMDILGSVSTARFIHRIAATVFVIQSVAHVAEMGWAIHRRRFRPSMMIAPQDFFDAILMLRYSVGLAPTPPRFDRFDYKQKFEYWGILFGAIIMIATGAMLWFPTIATRLLPGEMVPVAKEMHSGEALLAMLVVLLWHFYDVILSPAVFPLDPAMITGKISRERLMHEHPREYERLVSRGSLPAAPPVAGPEQHTASPHLRGPPGERPQGEEE